MRNFTITLTFVISCLVICACSTGTTTMRAKGSTLKTAVIQDVDQKNIDGVCSLTSQSEIMKEKEGIKFEIINGLPCPNCVDMSAGLSVQTIKPEEVKIDWSYYQYDNGTVEICGSIHEPQTIAIHSFLK